MTRVSQRPSIPTSQASVAADGSAREQIGAVPSVSGVVVLQILHSLREIVGAGPYVTGVASLPSDIRAQLEATTALSWVPIAVLGTILEAIAHTANRDPDTMLDDAVRLAVQHIFTTVWRVLLRVPTDAALIARTPIMYARSRNVGKLTASVVAPGKADITLREWPDVPARHVRMISIGIVRVVQLAGRTDVHIHSARTPDGAHYTLLWKP